MYFEVSISRLLWRLLKMSMRMQSPLHNSDFNSFGYISRNESARSWIVALFFIF
jgi:hypothetical protein